MVNHDRVEMWDVSMVMLASPFVVGVSLFLCKFSQKLLYIELKGLIILTVLKIDQWEILVA